MKAKMKSCVITGSNGFLGGALKKRLEELGWEVYETMRPDVDYVFLFGSPSSDHWFKYALSYSLRETIENFINAVDFCKEHNIKLVYPTSGVVGEGNTSYARCKQIIDILASIYSKNLLGFRIYAGYGVGEGHKGDYASIVYQFSKLMKAGQTPVIWGSGEQTRDFIYIDDIIDNIIRFKDEKGVIELGTGQSCSLNHVVELINKELGTNITPKHIEKPTAYIENSVCKNPCEYKVSLKEGIRKILGLTP